jgi:hypothetical protein
MRLRHDKKGAEYLYLHGLVHSISDVIWNALYKIQRISTKLRPRLGNIFVCTILYTPLSPSLLHKLAENGCWKGFDFVTQAHR